MYLEKYVIGEILANKNALNEYIGLGLNTAYFQYNIYKLLFMDLIANKSNNIDEIEKRIDIEKFLMVEAIETFNNQIPKLNKNDVVEQLITLKQKDDLKEFLKGLAVDVDVLPKDLLLQEIEKAKELLTAEVDTTNELYTIGDFIDLDNKENEAIVPPYSILAKYFNLVKGYLITVGSRTSMGKTAFCLDLGLKVSKRHNVLYVNLEMSNQSIINRVLANISEIPLSTLQSNVLTDDEIITKEKAIKNIKQLKFNILNCANTEYNSIIEKIRALHSKKQQEIIIIDYLTRIQYKGANRNLEVEIIVNKLKELAKELNTCIIVVSQLSREIEKRQGHIPILADLRDSGGVEQASDVVLLLHRADYYNNENKNNQKAIMNIIIAKNRDGETTDNIKLGFKKNIQKFEIIPYKS